MSTALFLTYMHEHIHTDMFTHSHAGIQNLDVALAFILISMDE